MWVDMGATGYLRWFERLLAELGFELWIGDPAEINAKRVKKLKYDRYDERGLSLEETVQRARASAVREAGVGSLG